MTVREHCWHPASVVTLAYPAHPQQHCRHCGATRRGRYGVQAGHGPWLQVPCFDGTVEYGEASGECVERDIVSYP